MTLVNAFSANMLPEDGGIVHFVPVSREYAAALAEGRGSASGSPVVSAVGHADTAAVFAAELGVPVACNRANIVLERGGSLLLGQYSGPRLPEGATALPEFATIRWMVVTLD